LLVHGEADWSLRERDDRAASHDFVCTGRGGCLGAGFGDRVRAELLLRHPLLGGVLLASSTEFFDQTFENLEEWREAEFCDRRFEGCTFVDCAFAQTVFRRCVFIDCKFKDCDLSNAVFSGSRIIDASFADCKLVGVNWTAASAVSHLSFERCALSYALFTGLDLRKSVWRDCLAKEADFADANLSEADLRGTDLIGARFVNTNLMKADLSGSRNYAIRPDQCKIKKAKFTLPEATLLLYGLDIELEE
jgi:uncharacterized protein YjbI with pentapeptide repeats